LGGFPRELLRLGVKIRDTPPKRRRPSEGCCGETKGLRFHLREKIDVLLGGHFGGRMAGLDWETLKGKKEC